MGLQLMPTGTFAPSIIPRAPRRSEVAGVLELDVLSQQAFCAKAVEAAARMAKMANFIVKDGKYEL